MYRILAEHAEVRERRNQLRHPAYHKPELLATGPNQVWSWDITKLRGPSKGVYYYLYVIIDIYSRYVVGWLIAEVESAELAEQLIAETCAKQGVQRAQLTIHADNGSPMIAKTVAILLADLGVAKSHSRPHVSNDNPYSEAQFKTLKYRPDYPDRFGSVADARQLGPQLLRLVQRPAPSQRAGVADAGGRAYRTGRNCAPAAPGRAAAGLPGPPRTLHAKACRDPPSCPPRPGSMRPNLAQPRRRLCQPTAVQQPLQCRQICATLQLADRRIEQRCGATRAPRPPTV